MLPIEILQDNFNDNSFDTAKWTGVYGTVVEQNRRLELECLPGYSGLTSNGNYSLTNSEMFAKIIAVPQRGNGTTETYLELIQDNDNKVSFIKSDSLLYFRTRVAGVNQETSVEYNSTEHKWWKIREDSGTLYFETSTNGTDWTTQSTTDSPVYTTSVYVSISTGYYGSESSPKQFVIDNFNVPPERINRGKTFSYKVYDQFDNYIRDITNDVIDTPTFTQEINSAGSELRLELARNLDDFGEDFDIAFNNIVKIYITDSEVTNELFFIGRIVNYTPRYGREGLEVILFSLGYELDYLIYKTAEVAEQSQLSGTSEVIIGPDSKIAQSFIPDQATITSLKLKGKAEIVQTNINVSIRPDSNNRPSVTALDNSAVTVQISNTTAEELLFIFSPSVVVEPGETYWLVVEAT